MDFIHSGWNGEKSYFSIKVALNPTELKKLDAQAVRSVEQKTGGTFYVCGTNNTATLSLKEKPYTYLAGSESPTSKNASEVKAAFRRILKQHI